MSEDENALMTMENGDNENNVRDDGAGPGETEELAQLEESSNGLPQDSESFNVKKRLGQQAKKHQREIRALHDRLAQMQELMQPAPNRYESPGQPDPASMGENEKIQHAVRMALGMRDQEQRQAEEGQKIAHVQKQYQRLNDEFDRASDKYEDFDDVVRGDDAPFTPHVRDALLLVENPAEVAYKLGKSRAELERISKLHPIDQAREINKLSFALLGGSGGNKSQPNRSAPLGGVRVNPGASQTITGKTSPSVIRARMKAGDWK